MYLHYYGKLPETINDHFVINDSIHSLNTRSDSKIHIEILKEQIMENFLFTIEEQ